MRKTIVILTMLICSIGLWAQIPVEVTNVMDRSRAVMANPAGIEYVMDMKAGMAGISMKMKFVIAMKGKMSRVHVTSKIMGMEIVQESGFDGTDTWEIDYSSKGDTITFVRGDKREKGKGDMEFDFDKKYNKAKMKLKDGFYDIDFSDPKDKTNEVKKISVKISANDYHVCEIRSGALGSKVVMTISKVRFGIKDSYFKVDLSKHPGAVVIRK